MARSKGATLPRPLPAEALNPDLYQKACPECDDLAFVIRLGRRRDMFGHRTCRGCEHCDDPVELARPCPACRAGSAIFYGREWRKSPERTRREEDAWA
jgi:ssDNA-binding Zn-finger/Zn-ribbon topoisomerase 1